MRLRHGPVRDRGSSRDRGGRSAHLCVRAMRPRRYRDSGPQAPGSIKKERAVTVVPILANNAFDSETTELLAAAFEAAWQAAKASDGTLADHAQAAAARNTLGKRIIEMGRRGERD